MHLISIHGMQIAYERWGPEAGVPLVLMHGFTGHRDDFVRVAEDLSRGRPVLVPDLRGHGDSGRAGGPDAYSFAACIQDLIGFLDALSISECDLLGHSMGGMVALRFALQSPARLRSLILMSTSPSKLPEATNQALIKGQAFLDQFDLVHMQRAMEAVGRADPDPVISRWADLYWPHQQRRYAAMDPDAYRGFARAMLEQDPVIARLGEIRMPTSVVVGSADLEFLAGTEALVNGIEGARENILEQAGHHPHEEEREQFMLALERHFEAL